MAAVSCRVLLRSSHRNIFTSAARLLEKYGPDPIEHATGLEKKQLLAQIAGDDDPFSMNVLTRGPGTEDCPNQIPSAFGARIVGCICEEDQMHVKWMWLYDGLPRRCKCGHWFKLVYKAPLDPGH